MAVTVTRTANTKDDYDAGKNTRVDAGHLFVMGLDKDGAIYNVAVYAPGAWHKATTTED